MGSCIKESQKKSAKRCQRKPREPAYIGQTVEKQSRHCKLHRVQRISRPSLGRPTTNPHLDCLVMWRIVLEEWVTVAEAQAAVARSNRIKTPGLPEGLGALEEITEIESSLVALAR